MKPAPHASRTRCPSLGPARRPCRCQLLRCFQTACLRSHKLEKAPAPAGRVKNSMNPACRFSAGLLRGGTSRTRALARAGLTFRKHTRVHDRGYCWDQISRAPTTTWLTSRLFSSRASAPQRWTHLRSRWTSPKERGMDQLMYSIEVYMRLSTWSATAPPTMSALAQGHWMEVYYMRLSSCPTRSRPFQKVRTLPYCFVLRQQCQWPGTAVC